MKAPAVLYCRVSSPRQVKEGHGLDAQESRGKHYAEGKGYDLEDVFRDEGVSGGLLDRPGIQKLLRYLEERPAYAPQMIVIVDDISRWARDVIAHFELKKAIHSRNARLECVAYKIEDSPSGRFVETIMAAHSEMWRGENRVKVIGNMRARLEAGYWPFDAPPGYRLEKVTGHGKLLVPDRVKDKTIKEALEGFASGRLPEQTDVQQFLASRGFFHRKKPKKVHLEQVKRLLTRVLYAGCIEYPKWGVTRRKGHHQGLIALPTFERIEERLGIKAKAPKRADINADFPLRGFVCCAECKKPMTASWAKGRKDRHPYYRCNAKGCALYNKSIPRNATKKAPGIEDEFADLLRRLTPKEGITALTKAVILDFWQTETASVKKIIESREQRIKDIEAKIKRNHERIEETDNDSLIRGYEERIEELKAERLKLGGSVKKMRAAVDFETALDKVMQFVANPAQRWEGGILNEQRIVLRLVFTEKLLYRKGEGFETASLSLPFALSGMVGVDRSRVVEMPGVEPGSNV